MTLTLAQQLRELQLKYNGPIPEEEQAKIDRLMNPPKGSQLAIDLRRAEYRYWWERRRRAKTIADSIKRQDEIQRIEHWMYGAFMDWRNARMDRQEIMRRAAE